MRMDVVWYTHPTSLADPMEKTMCEDIVRKLIESLEWMIENDDTNEGDEPLYELGGRSWNEVNDYWIHHLIIAKKSLADAKEFLENTAR